MTLNVIPYFRVFETNLEHRVLAQTCIDTDEMLQISRAMRYVCELYRQRFHIYCCVCGKHIRMMGECKYFHYQPLD